LSLLIPVIMDPPLSEGVNVRLLPRTVLTIYGKKGDSISTIKY
jgi:hypothetical protein